MRKIPVALTVVALAAVALTGCSPSAADACPRPSADPEVAKLVTVTGDQEDVPRVKVYTPLHTDELVVADVTRGEGTPITTPDQVAVVDISVISAETGEEIVSTPYDGDLSRAFALSRWEQTFPTFDRIVECATEGSRIVAALPPGDVAPDAAASFGMSEEDSVVLVVDVRKVFLPRADGANQFNADRGVPSVVRAPDGRPGIIVPDGAAPSELVVQTLKKGDGEAVSSDAPFRAHYTGLTWDDRDVFETTWDGEPASLTLDSLVPGVAEALEGATVGSQVLVVVPPELGYGDEERAGIPAGSTLVFVFDILGIDAAPAE